MDVIVSMSRCDTYEVFLSGKGNHRYAVLDTYKGQRQSPKPHHYSTIGDILQEDYGAWVIDGVEADDALSILSRQDPEVVIGSRDKDLLQVPGWHFNWSFKKKQYLLHTDAFGSLRLKDGKIIGSGLMFLYSQILMGDRTDNYFGIHKLGPSAAFHILNGSTTEKELWERTYWTYHKHYGPEEGLRQLLVNARCAHLLEEGDMTYDAGNHIRIEPKGLWSPRFDIPSGF